MSGGMSGRNVRGQLSYTRYPSPVRRVTFESERHIIVRVRLPTGTAEAESWVCGGRGGFEFIEPPAERIPPMLRINESKGCRSLD